MRKESKGPRYIKHAHCYYMDYSGDTEEGETRKVQVVDATKPMKYWVGRDHLWGSSSKADPKPGNVCVQERALCSLDYVYDALFQKTICLIIFNHNRDVARRFTPERDGKVLAEINDTMGKKGLKEVLSSETQLELKLLVPRRNRSLEYLQSDTMQDIREKYAAGEGSRGPLDSPRSSPTSRGFRNGTKKSPWHARAK